MKNSPLSRLLSGLRREPHDFRPSLHIFPELNSDRIAADLDLVVQAEKNGSINEPPASSATADMVEMQVIERVDQAKRDAFNTLTEELRVYARRIGGLEFEERFNAIQQAAPAAVGDFRAEAAVGRGELVLRRRAVIDVEKNWESFKAKQRIDRVPQHASGASLILKIGILMVVAVLEIVMNGNFLAKGNSMGLLGGIVEAALLAALNIGVSFGAGIFSRQINKRGFFAKLAGLISILFWICFSICLNLMLAHYREINGTLIEDAGREVMARMWTNPLGVNDMKSWLLFGIGMACSAFAYGEAFLIFDPIPGYGQLHNRVQAAHDEYNAHYAHLIDKLKDIRDEALETMADASRDLSIRRGEYDAIIEGRARLIQLFASYQDHLESAANRLLKIYREANSRSRKGEPAPQRFQEPYAMMRIPVAAEMVEATSQDDLRQQIAKAQGILEEQSKAIHTEYESAMRSYRELEHMVPEAADEAQQLKAA